jgi:Protein of unknown function (DUF2769)
MMPGKDIIPFMQYSSVVTIAMKSPMDNPQEVEDTEENLGKCICKLCPTFKNNKLADYSPTALFCSRGISQIASQVKATNCYCLGCDLFIKHGLVISHRCVKG